MDVRLFLKHPLTRVVAVALLTGVLSYASGSSAGDRKGAARETARCDSIRTVLVAQRDSVARRADSLWVVLDQRRHPVPRAVASAPPCACGHSNWIANAGSFILGGVVGYLIGDRSSARATATAISSSIGPPRKSSHSPTPKHRRTCK